MLKIVKKHKYIITFIIILLIIILCIMRKNKLKENNKEYTISTNIDVIEEIDIEKEIKEEHSKIIVDIKGQVNKPGVYELTEGSRVIDLINLAGGLTKDANTSLINLSKKLEDSMVIIIYSNYEVENSNVKEIETVFKIIEKECNCPVIENDGCINTEIEKEDKDNIDELININTATIEELMTLPGVGESKANSIIEYRENKKFETIEDIKNVSGIGELVFEKIKAYITI